MPILRQLLKEFWLPAIAAVLWSIVNLRSSADQSWTWTKAINVAAPTFFFVSWLTSQYFRVKKQEHVASTLQSIETRVNTVMTEVERQASGLKYLADAQVVQTFDECIDRFREAKEEIADRSRQLKLGDAVDASLFSLNRENPFYSGRRYLYQLIRYGRHCIAINRQTDLEKQFSVAATNVEELAGNIGTFISRLNAANIAWNTPRSRGQLVDILDAIDLFRSELLAHSKFSSQPYKGTQVYATLIQAQIQNLRTLAAPPSAVQPFAAADGFAAR